MNGECDICGNDLIVRPAVTVAVFDYPGRGVLRFELCALHEEMAHDPGNGIRVLTSEKLP